MNKQRVILIADDDENDSFFMSQALRKAALDVRMVFVANGEAAIEYFEGVGKYADRSVYPLPDVVILDIKMPRKSGLEALKWLRASQKLSHMPVMIVSGSAEEKDIEKAKRLGADNYVVKPESSDALARELKRFVLFYATSTKARERHESVRRGDKRNE